MDRRVHKNGLTWCIVQLEDLVGGIEVLFFPQAYAVYGMDIAEDAIVLVKARVSIRDDRMSLIGNDLAVPDISAIGVARPLSVSLPLRQCTKDKLSALKQVFDQASGDVRCPCPTDRRNRNQLVEGRRRPSGSNRPRH